MNSQEWYSAMTLWWDNSSLLCAMVLWLYIPWFWGNMIILGYTMIMLCSYGGILLYGADSQPCSHSNRKYFLCAFFYNSVLCKWVHALPPFNNQLHLILSYMILPYLAFPHSTPPSFRFSWCDMRHSQRTYKKLFSIEQFFPTHLHFTWLFEFHPPVLPELFHS